MKTVDKIRELAATDSYSTMTAIGQEVGVSRERVRQLIRQHNIFWQDFFVLLEWECPGCGAAISITLSRWQKAWGYMPAHCRTCARQHKDKFCIRGHLREDEQGEFQCLVCMRERARCVAEVRTCEICELPLNISRGMLNQIRNNTPKALGKYHYDCYMQNRREQTHCKHGHEFTPANTRIEKGGSRKCRECERIRTREYRQRQQAAKKERHDNE